MSEQPTGGPERGRRGAGIESRLSRMSAAERQLSRQADFHNPSPAVTEQRATDAEVEADFFAAFHPLPAPESQLILPDNSRDVHIAPRKDTSVASYVLPPGTIILDADGKELRRITEYTEVDVEEIKRINKNSAPRFTLQTIFPAGRDAGGVEVRGQQVIRRGLRWLGQTTEPKRKKSR